MLPDLSQCKKCEWMTCECNTFADSALCWLTSQVVRETNVYSSIEGAVFQFNRIHISGHLTKCLIFPDMSWPWFLSCLKCQIFGFVFLLTCTLQSSYTLVRIFYFAVTVFCRSHPLAGHDWSITYNACTLLVKLLFSHYFSKHLNNMKTNPNPDIFGNLEILARIFSKRTYDQLKLHLF